MRIQLSMDSTGIGYFPGLAEPVTIDSRHLPEEKANELECLVKDACFFDQPAQPQEAARGLRDARQYTITIQEGRRRHTITLSDPVDDPALQKLLDEIQSQAQVVRQRQAKSKQG